MLPALSPDEQRHGEAVAALIRAELAAAGGWLSFERFMELALYAPGLGYYSAGSWKLGGGGDFVTAPEVSELFGRCVAAQCAPVLRATGAEVLELGAGTGSLAATVLAALDAAGALPERYAILEVSGDLAARQRARLEALPAHLRARVVWLERLPPTPLRGVILANEVADALPVRRFRLRGGTLQELGVALAPGGALQDAERAPDAALAEACAAMLGARAGSLPDGYTSEVSLRLGPWIAALAACLERGSVLLFDYGLPRSHYYHAQRAAGTLRCHFRQRAHDDPFVNLGLQDITAWVDFTRVAEAASLAGLEVSGFATQAAFLLALGLERAVAAAPDAASRARLAGEARRLVMPEEMGEAFKVMALTRGYAAPLAGFTLQDLRRQL
ncbi:MAG TPA: SAM-dependent methyltransferase [Candidatus Eisenbacteria bacterium]|nr:SAM-dependent methyltransferase [Candidatus Eisenbacteria bacterium]